MRLVSVGVSSTQLPKLKNTVTKTENLRTVPVECHGDDTPLIFHDTHFFSLLILLVHISKFNVHDTLTEIGLSGYKFILTPLSTTL